MNSSPSDPITPEQVKQSYEAADSFVREVSNFHPEVAIPSHNELRHAGHHFIAAMSDPDNINRDESTKCYARKLVTGLSGGVFGLLDAVLKQRSFDDFGSRYDRKFQRRL